MTRQAYPKYKSSGVVWFGYIPEHWEIKRLKYLAKTIMGQSPNSDAYTFDESARPFLQGNAEFGTRHPEAKYFCDAAMKEAPKGALLLSVRAPVGALNMADQNYGIGRGLCAVVADHTLLLPSFAWHALAVTRRELWSIATGSTYEAVSAEEVAAMTVTVPPVNEQRSIASFLDRETTRIDALIEKKERQIELLQEKRGALISHAVTGKMMNDECGMMKKYDSGSPHHSSFITPHFKDSGIEWLGEIPEHWEVLAFKRMGDFQAGAGFPNGEQGLEDDELPFYKVSDMNLPGNEVFMTTHNNAVSQETARRLRAHVFPHDTIVFAKVGAALLLNKRRILTRPSCIDNNMMGFIRRSCHRNWAYYWMCSLDLGELVNPGAVPSINEGQIREIRVPVPPLDEQKAIAAFLDQETTRIDTLIEKIRKSIDLLREYRTALISAAVTGKIDVRKEVV